MCVIQKWKLVVYSSDAHPGPFNFGLQNSQRMQPARAAVEPSLPCDVVKWLQRMQYTPQVHAQALPFMCHQSSVNCSATAAALLYLNPG